MTTAKRPDLTPDQLVWLRQNIRSFAPAERQVTQRDESSAESNAKAMGCWPGEVVGFFSPTCTQITALSPRRPLRLRLAERSQRENPGERA